MHVAHLDDQVIATRCVLGFAIPLRSGETSSVRLARLVADLSNGTIQQTPSSDLKLRLAGGADTFSLEETHVGVGPAERAGVGHLAEHDVSRLDRYQQLVTLVDVEHSTRLGRDDDPSQVVDLSSDT
jgi:hypothetical protein